MHDRALLEQGAIEGGDVPVERYYPAKNIHDMAGSPQRFRVGAVASRRVADGSTDAVEITLQPEFGVPEVLKPGMQIGMFVRNDAARVAEVLERLAAVPVGEVAHRVKGSATTQEAVLKLTAAEIMERYVDLSRPSQGLLLWLAQCEVPEGHRAEKVRQRLQEHLVQGRGEEIQRSYTVSDLLWFFEGVVTFEAVVGHQPPLANRKYTLSDVDHREGTFSLLVGGIRHPLHQTGLLGEDAQRGVWQGASSQRLLETQPGDVHVGFLDFRKHKIPYPAAESDVPVLMVSTGVGIAPHLAYLREVERQGGRAGARMLISGGRSAHDGLAEEEIQGWVKTGVLAEYHYAASRGEKPQYVQDVMREKGEEVYRMLEAGGMVAVCGLETMLDGVRRALKEIVAQRGHEPEAWLAQFERGAAEA